MHHRVISNGWVWLGFHTTHVTAVVIRDNIQSLFNKVNFVQNTHNTVQSRYNMVQHNMILFTALQWLGQNLIKVWIKKRHHIPHPHGRAMGCLLWGFGRKWTVLQWHRTLDASLLSHNLWCISWLCYCCVVCSMYVTCMILWNSLSEMTKKTLWKWRNRVLCSAGQYCNWVIVISYSIMCMNRQLWCSVQ